MFFLGVAGIFADNFALFLLIRRIRHTVVPNTQADADEFLETWWFINEKVIHRFAPIDTAPEMCYYCENFILYYFVFDYIMTC